MTATATKRAPATAAPESIMDIAFRDGHRLQTAVLDYFGRLDDDSLPAPTMLAAARQIGIPVDEPHQLKRFISKCQQANRLMSEAGSAADLEKAQGELTAANEADALQAPEIRQQAAELQKQIDALTAKLNALSEARATAQHKVAGMQATREALRSESILPPWVWADYQHSKRFRNEGELARLVNTLETRVVVIDRILALDPTSREALQHAEVVKRVGLLDVHTTEPVAQGIRQDGWLHANERRERQAQVNPTAWENYCGELRREHAAAIKELAILKPQLEQDSASAESIRDYYVNQL